MPNRNAASRGTISTIATFARLLLLAGLLWSIFGGPGHPWVWVASIIVADIFDGVLARSLGCDTIARRAADAVVDRISIHAAFGIAIVLHPAFLALYAPLVVRDFLALAASGVLLTRHGVLLMGGHWHKLASIGSACFGVTVLSAPYGIALAAGAGAVILNWLLLCDYAGGYLAWKAGPELTAGRYKIRGLAGIRTLLGAASVTSASIDDGSGSSLVFIAVS